MAYQVIARHFIKPAHQKKYSDWLKRLSRVITEQKGYISCIVQEDFEKSQAKLNVVFEDEFSLQEWASSPAHKILVDEVKEYFLKKPESYRGNIDEIRALVTGTSSGIGYALVLELLKRPATRLVITARRDAPLKAIAAQYPNRVFIISADLSSTDGWDAIVNSNHPLWPLTHVVHNAATEKPVAKISELKIKDLRTAFSVNTEAPLFITRDLIKYKRLSEKARILFTSSGIAFYPLKGLSSYGITKSGLENLRSSLSLEYPEYLFASVRPGAVITEMSCRLSKEDMKTFPHADVVQKRMKDGSMLTAEKSAKYMANLLLDTSSIVFPKHWNINKDQVSKQPSFLGKVLKGARLNPKLATFSLGVVTLCAGMFFYSRDSRNHEGEAKKIVSSSRLIK